MQLTLPEAHLASASWLPSTGRAQETGTYARWEYQTSGDGNILTSTAASKVNTCLLPRSPFTKENALSHRFICGQYKYLLPQQENT